MAVAENLIPVRDTRIFPLNDTTRNPASECLDMVLFFPYQEGKKYRIWLNTKADSPNIRINEKTFYPLNCSETGWFDFGLINFEDIMITPFGQIYFYNIGRKYAPDSYCIITSQIDKKLCGDIIHAEKELFGITREEVGYSYISPNKVTVGEPTVFKMIYTPAMDLPQGSFIRLSFPGAFAKPQLTEPNEDGFLKISSPALSIYSIDTSIESHEKIDAIFKVNSQIPKGEKVEFCYRTDFTYIFSRKFDECERRYWWAKMPPLSVAIAIDKNMLFVPPLKKNSHSVEFIPGPTSRLHLFLPGRRHENEKISLTGLFTDEFRNIDPQGWLLPDFNLFLVRDKSSSVPLESPDSYFVSKYRFVMPLRNLKPDVYRVEARSSLDDTLLAISNPLQIVEKDSPHPNIYWGEIHGHCEMSDGSGKFEEMFRHARDDAAMDFAASADHACYFTDNQWIRMQSICNAFNKDNSFITLVGYEWAGYQGHRNIYTDKNSLKLFRGMHPGTRNLDAVYNYFHGDENIVAGPHTGHTKDFFDCHDETVQKFVELYSMWGVFDEMCYDILEKGAKIGFTGGGDCHEGHCGFSTEALSKQGKVPHGFAKCIFYKCGMTGAFMSELSRTQLLNALKHCGTYATTGARILLDFSLTNKGDIKVECHACDKIERIEIVKNKTICHTVHPDSEDAVMEWQDETPSQGSWYVIHVVQYNGEQAWSSPKWID